METINQKECINKAASQAGEFDANDLKEAQRQIASILHKLRATLVTLESKDHPERYKSQITLAKRRIEALEIANELIERELEKEYTHA